MGLPREKRGIVGGIIAVGVGGFLGSVCRYVLGFIPVDTHFPLATFLINFAGSFLIGVVFEIASSESGMDDTLLLFLKTGFCGGFTTFSTFSLETLTLLDEGRYGMGAAYACGSVVVCLAGVFLGRALTRSLRSASA